ncbi:Signal transduction protein MDG1 [Colletotrichum fructicola]|nr:Signal transduction protein MDG1 [Colletotrichum fructicola]
MGTFKFTWAHPAEEVYVTGTFDNWTKSEKLDKVGDAFEKTVTLPEASEKIYYKLPWAIGDHTAPQEPDHEGNVNNFLTPVQIVKEDSTAAVMNTVTPESTTAALAKDVPLEKDDLPQETPSDIPGGFPVTPANELDKVSFGVNPLPAQDVTAEPIKVEAGEPLPASVKAGDINEHVKLDKEGYEDSSALPGLSKEETTVPAVTSATIPESSLPVPSAADVTINSAAPTSTTAALAAEVPVETKAEVPEVVKEAQEKAHADPEASANPEAVQEKAVVEDELLEKVPEAPSTSEGTSGFGTQKSENVGAIAATAATAGGIAVAAAVAAKDSVVEAAAPAVDQATVAATDAAAKLPEPVKESLPVPVQEAIGTQVKEETREEVAPEVPAVVKEAITESGKSPEAAANTEAVVEKKEVEAELLKEVKTVPAVGEEAEKTKTEAVKDEVKETKEEVKEGDKSKTEAVKEEAKLAKEEVKEAVTKDEPKEANGTHAVNGTNGATTKEPEAPATPAKAASSVPESTSPSTTNKATDSPAATEKKKKNRLSAFIGKLKSKVHSK